MPTKGMVLASRRQGLAKGVLNTSVCDLGSVTLPQLGLLFSAGSLTLLIAYIMIKKYAKSIN